MTLTLNTDGLRLDAALAALLPELSRSAVQRLLEDGAVTLDGRPVRKNAKLPAGTVLNVEIPEAKPTENPAQDIPLDVVYEDDDVIVVNKPKGLVVHPAPGHPDGTLVNALIHHCGDSLSGVGGEKRPGIVHRIDKDTSGLLIAAKNDFAHAHLAAQLKDHSLARTYECIVCGNLREDSGTIDAPIGRDPVNRKKMAVTEKNSRSAVTHWEVIARYPGVTHLRCRLETGRTHQIRVHMKYIGHTLFNDERYGGHDILKGTTFTKYKQFVQNCVAICPRQALHAKTLGFVHPTTGEEMFFDSEIPSDMQQLIDRWRVYANTKEL